MSFRVGSFDVIGKVRSLRFYENMFCEATNLFTWNSNRVFSLNYKVAGAAN